MSWQPIETAPKDGTLIDVWCVVDHMPPVPQEFRWTDVKWVEGDGWCEYNDQFGEWTPIAGGEGWHITHWRPLPEGPNELA